MSGLRPGWRIPPFLVSMWQSESLFTDEPIPRPIRLAPPGLEHLIGEAESVILPVEARNDPQSQRVAYSAAGLPPDGSPPAELAELGQFKHLTTVGGALDRWEGKLLAYAKAITNWHHRHRF